MNDTFLRRVPDKSPTEESLSSLNVVRRIKIVSREASMQIRTSNANTGDTRLSVGLVMRPMREWQNSTVKKLTPSSRKRNH